MWAADRNGAHVGAGTRYLSGWTRRHVLSMVGEIYEVENIGLYGQGGWIRKSWSYGRDPPAMRLRSNLSRARWRLSRISACRATLRVTLGSPLVRTLKRSRT